jgi:FAD/FMN-containing dehydrogenase
MTINTPALARRGALKALAGTGLALGASGLLVACNGAGHALTNEEKGTLNNVVEGKVYWRGDEAYETARGSTCYRMNKPKRYPQVIVQPANDKDVVAAVKFAKAHGLKVTTRSGGHSWSAAHIRDDVVLIDMGRMQEITIDEKAQTLWVNPGMIGSVINRHLEPLGLIVPTAHHPSPGIGGFCMNGGFGWNSRLWGNGARHVLAIDVVTADGDLIRADATQNSDYWWAARGGGAGFFGVITRMQLQARPRPKVWKATVYSFDDARAVFDDVMTWACNIVPKVPPYLELVMSTTANSRETGAPCPTRISIAALALTDDETLADNALALLDSLPHRENANFKVEKAATTLEDRYQSGFKADPAGMRFAVDNMYTDAPTEQLVPRLRKMFLDLPTPHTHTFWFAWGPCKPFSKDMVLSMQGPIFLGTYTLWENEQDDEKMTAWPPMVMKELSDISLGGQLNDENMLHHPQRYFTDEAWTKYEALRQKHDPEGRFEGFLGKPMPT